MFFILIVIIFAFLQLKSLFLQSWYVSHDGIFHLIRTKEFVNSLNLGYFPPRWAFHLDNNFGLPVFNFIYPGPYYLTSFFQFLGFSSWLAVKILIILSFVLAGLGVFLILQKKQKSLALLASFLYLLVPYHFLNIFVRAALGEIVAIALMPWVWLGFQNLADKKKMHWYHPLALFLLFLSHNFLAVFFFLFLLFYLIIFKKLNKTTILSLLFSLGLAAFFLLPMLVEAKYLTSIVDNKASYQYYDKAVSLKKLVYSPWGFGFSLPKSEEQMSFQLGLANILVFLLAIVIFLKNRKNKLALFYIFIFILAVFLITPQSSFLINFFPWLSFVHFPYRFLFLTTFLTPLLAFEVLYFFFQKNKSLAFILGFFLLSLALYNTRNYKKPMLFLNKNEVFQELIVHQHSTTTTNRGEVLPFWVKEEREFNSQIEKSSQKTNILKEQTGDSQYYLLVDDQSEKEAFLFLPKNYFPSWQLKVDGGKDKDLLTFSSKGWLKLQLLKGEHKYQVYLGKTSVEFVAELITLSSFAVLIIYNRRTLV